MVALLTRGMIIAGVTRKCLTTGLDIHGGSSDPRESNSQEEARLLKIETIRVAPKEVCTPPEEHGRDRDPQGKADGCNQGQPGPCR